MPSTRQLRRSTAKKQRYLKLFGTRIKRGDKAVPTFAQWAKFKTKRTKTVEKAASAQLGKGESLSQELRKLRRRGHK